MRMKALLTAFAAVLAAGLQAAVPVEWQSDVTKPETERREAFHGTTLELEATLVADGRPLAVTNGEAWVYWQTNDMGVAFWRADAAVSGNVVRATFTPEMDPGVAVVNGFLGTPREQYAEFQLRFRPSPGAEPNVLMQPPVLSIDFARVTVTNAPWATPSITNGLVTASITNGLVTASITNGLVTASVTNGLVTASITNGLVTASITNGLVTASITNGLVTASLATNAANYAASSAAQSATNYTDTATNELRVSFADGLAAAAKPYPFCALLDNEGDGTSLFLEPFVNYRLAVTAQDYELNGIVIYQSPSAAMRDLWLAVDALAVTNAPTLVWGGEFHPLGGDADNLGCEAQAVNLYMISEFWPGNFLVARQAFTNLVTEAGQ